MSHLTVSSLPSPTSSVSSVPTPLTPNSGHNVSFASTPLNDQQYNFDALLDNASPVNNNANTATTTGNGPAQPTQGGPVRRKPSRRANTAERRATHNAVERQRRETLNGRFLDLAALLPNLASVRRPSKSAIVNSSIALIHTQRRARSTAARELRLLKLEADALRAEVNEWRERAGMGLARIDEPVRSRDFEELVSGGLEEAEETLLEEERRALEIAKEGLRLDAAAGGDMQFAYGMDGYGGLGDEDEDGSSDGQPAGRGASGIRPGSQGSIGIPALPAMPVNNNTISRQNSFVQQHQQPMIFDPNAAMLQQHHSHHQAQAIQGFPTNFDLGPAATQLGLTGLVNPSKRHSHAMSWDAQLYNAYAGFQPQTFPTPPTSANGPGSANFLSGFGLRLTNEDLDNALENYSPPIQQRTRAASTIQTANLNMKSGSCTPPSSAPPTTTTYTETQNGAGDAFAAAYGAAFNATSGRPYGGAMGLFM